MRKLKRTVHFDMHTQAEVYDVGADLDSERFAEVLLDSKVNFINFFARCNRGFSYYPTKVGIQHPSLNGKDIYGSVLKSCHKRGIGVCAYFNSVINQAMADAHPEWTRSRLPSGNGSYMCFNTPYLDHLESEVKEIFELYPETDGIFLDCIGLAGPCKNEECREDMIKRGLDPDNDKDVADFDRELRIITARRIRDAVPEGKYFYCNGIREIQDDKYSTEVFNTHSEIECIPGEGAWGYDCFPTMISYLRHFHDTCLFMTGRFHRDWNDYGGIRSEASLESDAFTALAYGAQITIGDCIHPRVTINYPLMNMVKNIYTKVERVEKWTDDAKYIPEIGVFCCRDTEGDWHNTFGDNVLSVFKGVQRMLAELKYQFDIVDRNCDLSCYPVLILPDVMTLSGEDEKKIKAYLDNGGKVISSGWSGMDKKLEKFALPQWNFSFEGIDNNVCSYFSMKAEGIPNFPQTVYTKGILMKAENSLAPHIASYDVKPNDFMYFQPDKESGYSAVGRNGNVTHVCFRIFNAYSCCTYPPHKYLMRKLLEDYLPDNLIKTDLPTYARATLTGTDKYYLLHLLSYCAERRSIPVIEEGIDLYHRHISLKLPKAVEKVIDADTEETVPFELKNGRVCVETDVLSHKILVFVFKD